jgi:hypothetical protein
MIRYSNHRPDGSLMHMAPRQPKTQAAAVPQQQQQRAPQQMNMNDMMSTINSLGGNRPIQADTFSTSKQLDPLYGQQAQDLRNRLYSTGWNTFQNAQNVANDYMSSAQGLFNNPFWNSAMSELQSVSPNAAAANQQVSRTLSGDYLTARPELMNAMRAIQGTAERNAEDQNAQIRSRMGASGMGFSTADAQAQQASSAAQRSQAEATATAAIAENYARERANQEQAVNASTAIDQARASRLGMASDMMGARLGLMQNAATVGMAPMQGFASLLNLSKADAAGMENVQRKTPMDWAMMLAALTPQAQQSLSNTMLGRQNNVNWAAY